MESKYPITRTKLIVPRRRDDLLSRQRLLDIVNELLDLKLIIIAAPAGYGKTSLLIDFVHHTAWPICWLSLDPLDQDPFRFISHFIAALQSRFPDFGKNSFSVLNSTPQDRFDINDLVSTLVNDIFENIPEHFLVILDDYQLVEESDSVNQFVNRFLQDVDENCHLMVSSRRLLTLPDLPLLVARSQVGGISFEEISFSTHEIQDLLLQNYHLTISDTLAEEINQQAEGWITGLLLSTQFLDDEIGNRLRVARVSGVGLYDFLAQQVLEQQPKEIQEFLLRTSILEEFDAELCQSVIEKALGETADWQRLLDDVLKRNLFVLPVGDDQRLYLRYHHLFRDFLQTRMQQERQEETRKITIALADHNVARKDWERAFQLYLKVNAVDKIVALIELAGPAMVTAGKLLTLKQWLAALPPEMTTSKPSFLSLRAAILMASGEVNQSIALCTQVIDRLQADQDQIEVLSLSLIRRSVAYRIIGAYQDSLMDTRQALNILEDRGELGHIKAEALRALGGTLYLQGDIKEALVVLKQSLTLFESFDDQQNIPKVMFEIGLMHKVLGDYVLAEMMYQNALSSWESGGNLTWAANLLNNLGVLQHMRGEYEAAANNFEKAIEFARVSTSPRLEAFCLISLGDLYRDLDANREALEVYKQAQPIVQQVGDGFLLLYLDLAEGVLNRLAGDYAKAKHAFEMAREKALDRKSPFEIHLLNSEMAMLYLSEGAYQEALEIAKTAYAYFSAEGHQSELLKSAFVCALSLAKVKENEQALDYLDFILPTILENNYASPLIVQAREYKRLLNAVKGKNELKRQFSRILDRVEHFEEKLPAMRRRIRHQATVVPFAPPRMIIQSFGKAQVHLNSQLVSNKDWQTQTARELFFLFLAHPEGLTKEQVGLYFWPDASSDELKLRFKNSLYRLRRAVGKQVILLEDDYYHFNWSLDYEYDVEVFTKSLQGAKKAKDSGTRIDHLKKAIQQYKGEYLAEIDEIWAITDRQSYYQRYLDALMHLAELYMVQKSYKTALRYCFQALSEDSCLEDAHRLAMRIHAATGNRAAIVRQYEQCRVALIEEINAPPSKQTRELYETLIQ